MSTETICTSNGNYIPMDFIVCSLVRDYLTPLDSIMFGLTSHYSPWGRPNIHTSYLLMKTDEIKDLIEQLENYGKKNTPLYNHLSYLYLKRVTDIDLFDIYTDFTEFGLVNKDAFWCAAYLGDITMMRFFIKNKFPVSIDSDVISEAFDRCNIEALRFFESYRLIKDRFIFMNTKLTNFYLLSTFFTCASSFFFICSDRLF